MQSSLLRRMNLKLKLFTVDAFTDNPFTGNPAAVVPLDQALAEDVMQKIAFEMNLSETAFLTPPPNASSPWTEGNHFGLRWFTPKNEVPLCGHATLASAHVLFNVLGNKSSEIEFETLSGMLMARKERGDIVLDFPLNPAKPIADAQREKCLKLAEHVAGDKVKEVLFNPTTGKLLVRLNDSCTRKYLESLSPNADQLLRLSEGTGIKGLILTLQGDMHGNKSNLRDMDDYNFVSRYFSPWYGVSEDPVTGAAHTVLGSYWSEQLGLKKFQCRQCSARGGDLKLRIRDDGRIDIIGRGKTIIEGQINI